MSARATIALLGLRGSGKSTVARALAGLLGRPCVDLDEELLRWGRYAGWRAGTVGELLERCGQAWFREYEAAVLRRALEPSPRTVLATGGGVVERADNRVWLARAARCVYLDVPLAVLRARLGADPTPRPALLGGGDALAELDELHARRAPWYRGLAEVVIAAGELAPTELARRIATALGEAG